MAFPAVASSSVNTRPWPYDVFLSFRGEDTRNNFIAHLFKALDQKGIYTYMDDKKLEAGAEISPALLKAIKESRIVIIVLSENYASSTWCLDELREILKCRANNQQIVIPVFYKVLPSEVRFQKKKFGEALAKHADRFKKEIVQRWKEDLEKVAKLSGYHLTNGNEYEFINKIVRVVSQMPSPSSLNVPTNYPVGIESSVNDINALLSIGKSDKRMVGIFGVGGIGKTTIAEAVYNLIAHQFEDKCFLENVRENSKREYGLLKLQEKLLSQILRDSNLKVHAINLGKDVIKKRLRMKKVLLVLDDVDALKQLEALSGELDWFGSESRIIITTRNEHLLATHGVDLKYKMTELEDNEALKVFSRHAFHSDKPNDDFVELAKHALRYAGGNPLALRVVGSNLYGKGINHWKSELKKYKENPHTEIYDALKISYDGLEENEKNIFLDIACFFKGEDAAYVTDIHNSCDFYPDSGIRVLIDKSLITIKDGKLVMHDLLQDMGREIVRQESPNELGKRSRLWHHEDARYVLEENVGTENIQGILLDLPERGLIRCRSNTFENMKRLRYFICRNAEFYEEPTYLPNELRVLDWTLQSLPSSFRGQKLINLRICNGHSKRFKEGFKNLPNLSILEFIGLENLTEIPDISGIPNLQKLRIYRCKSLVKVHDSVGFLDKLAHLVFSECSNLISLPKSLKVKCGGVICFQNCSRLETFPEIECKVKRFGFTLEITSCRNLIHLPSSIFQLQQFNELDVAGCPKLVMIPTNVRDERQSPEESRDLFLSPPLPNSSISDVGCSSVVFSVQTGLKLDMIVFSVGILSISGSEIVSLPAWFKTFVRLRILWLDKCKQLQEIVELPANIEEIIACGCVSLKSFPQISRENQFNTSQLPSLQWIDLSDCYKMADKIGKEVEDFVLDKVHYKDSFAGGIIFPGNKIPDWFRHRMDCPMGSRTCIMDIKWLPHLDEIQGIVFCVVLESFSGVIRDIGRSAEFTMRNRGRDICKWRYFYHMESKNVWYEYFFEESFKLKGDRLQVRFVTDSKFTLRSFGVHIIHKHEENANDHPDMSRVESCFSFDEINNDWKISSIEDESDEERLELSECDKMAEKIGNDHVEDFLLEKVLSKDSFDGGIFPGNRIPDWFCHRMKCRRRPRSNSCIMNIKGLPHLDEILIQGIVFCAVLESADRYAWSYDNCVDSAKFTMRHKGIEIDKMRDFTSMESKHVWYEYFVLESFELNGDSLQVRLSTDFMSEKKEWFREKLFIRSFGVHIIHKHEENANDHPDMTHVESCFSFSRDLRSFEISSTQSDEESENSVGSIKEEESENLECLTKRNKIERIQPSKSRCDNGSDDGDYNLESSCFSVFLALKRCLGCK